MICDKTEIESILDAFLKLKYMADICDGKVEEIILDEKAYKFLKKIAKQHGVNMKLFCGKNTLELGVRLFGIKITERK
jgi:hypothetical protein